MSVLVARGKGDFAGAATAQAEVDALMSMPPSRSPMPPPPAKGGPKGGKNAQRGAGSGKGPVNLENLRVLSSSKVTRVPVRPGKGKGAGRTQGAGGKAGGRKGGGGKKGAEVPLEDFAALYLGCNTTKQIYTVLASGDDNVEKLRPYLELEHQPIVNIKNLDRRPGKEELHVTGDTAISTCLEPIDAPARFAYDVREVTKHLATWAVGTQAPLGHYVDLVLRVDQAESLPIQSGQNVGEYYLQLTGVDMDGQEVGPLRLWNHYEGDVEVGTVCILRGLKIAPERQWNSDRNKYVNDPEGGKKMDSDARTAIEDVSDNSDITHYFTM